MDTVQTPSSEELQLRLELKGRAFEGLLSLIKSLGNSLELEKVAKLSLLTVTGQLLVKRSALYLPSDGKRNFKLLQSTGVRANSLPVKFPFCDLMDGVLSERHGIADLHSVWALPSEISEHFEYAAYLRDADQPVALLLLGERIPGRRFDEAEESLLATMGVVIGTTVQRALTYEHMLRAKLKMEEADRLRRVILDHVSHEFNTPLMVAKSAVELARSAPPEKQGELFDMHREAVDRLAELVLSVLQVAESTTDTPTQLMTISHPKFISDVISPLLYRQDMEGFHIVEGHFPDSDVRLRVDPAKFKVALEGLVQNAHRFARKEWPWAAVHCYATSYRWWVEQDQLARLPLYREILDASPDKRMEPIFLPGESPPPGPHPDRDMAVVVEVIDSGIGIPEEEMDLVFQPFSQASNSPYRGVRGAGMGLASCRRMVKDNGGELVLRSREGEGSIFALVLPATWNRG